MEKAKHGWDRSEGVKYTISRFEEEEFQKWHENGGKEQLRKRIVFFDYSEKKCRTEKEERF